MGYREILERESESELFFPSCCSFGPCHVLMVVVFVSSTWWTCSYDKNVQALLASRSKGKCQDISRVGDIRCSRRSQGTGLTGNGLIALAVVSLETRISLLLPSSSHILVVHQPSICFAALTISAAGRSRN